MCQALFYVLGHGSGANRNPCLRGASGVPAPQPPRSAAHLCCNRASSFIHPAILKHPLHCLAVKFCCPTRPFFTSLKKVTSLKKASPALSGQSSALCSH